jgi:glutathione S-transferase
MAAFRIVLGNKNYSSWSLRAWLALERCGVPFEEEVIPLYRDDTKPRLLALSPAGKVPILKHGNLTVWDSLAIVEYLAEIFPDAGLWPEDPARRAEARAYCAEMHAGFADLRNCLPMCLHGERQPARETPGLAGDIARIVAIWEDRRDRFGAGGDFLFGAYGAADIFFTPVAARFAGYGVPLDGAAAAYRDALLSWPALQVWSAAAAEEPWVIRFP